MEFNIAGPESAQMVRWTLHTVNDGKVMLLTHLLRCMKKDAQASPVLSTCGRITAPSPWRPHTIHISSESKLTVFSPTQHITQRSTRALPLTGAPIVRLSSLHGTPWSLLVRYLAVPMFLDAPLRSASEHTLIALIASYLSPEQQCSQLPDAWYHFP